MPSTSTRAATIIPPNQGRTFSFFGNTVTYKFNGNGETNRIYELAGMTSRETPPLHTHPWDEWFYFLEGEVIFQVGDQTLQATPGYAITLPASVPHTFAIRSPQAKFLIWVSNAAAEQYLEELVEASQNQELTAAQIKAIAQKHHISYLA